MSPRACVLHAVDSLERKLTAVETEARRLCHPFA